MLYISSVEKIQKVKIQKLQLQKTKERAVFNNKKSKFIKEQVASRLLSNLRIKTLLSFI